MFLPHCLSNSEDRLACIADLEVVHADGQDHSHQSLRGRLCISLTACTHRSMRITTSFCSSEAKNFSPCYKRQIGCCCTFVSTMKIGTSRTNWYTKWKLVFEAPIPGNEQIAVPKLWGEGKKTLSLLCASQLVASDVAASLLARSFAKKNFKKNFSDQDSGEPFRRWFEIHRTGSPYRWTRS